MEILYIITAVLLAAFPTATAEAASISCTALKNVVVRSLFPMMVLSRMIAYSSLFDRLSVWVSKSKLWKWLGLSDCLIPAVLSGLMSGLPTSARETEALLKKGKITHSEASKAVALSSLPSPAFVITVASDSVMHGICRYFILLVTAVVTVGFFHSNGQGGESKSVHMTFPEAISSSTLSAISVSANIVFFSSVTCLISHILPQIKQWTAVIFEMGSGIVFAKGDVILQAVAVGWCGISALSQIKSEAPHISPRLYVFLRCISCVVLVAFEIIVKNI